MKVERINTKKTYQEIIEQIIKLIKEDSLTVGEKLPAERNLAEMFGVSRASIREAFRVMQIIGVIDVRPGEGTFITDLNISPFINTIAPLFVKNENMEKDLLDFRIMVELEAVKLAAQKGDDERVNNLFDAIIDMEKAVKENNVTNEAEADIKFHKEMFLLSDNYILIKVGECISYFLETSVRFNREKIVLNNENKETLLKHHKEIYDAIKKKDVNRAVKTMRENLTFVKEF